MKTKLMRMFVPVFVLVAFGLVLAGTLDPPGPPAPTMVTLQQIYDKIGTTGVPRTGQTNCWDTSVTIIPCAGTGQDGEYQRGASTSPRFTDNGNGTVKDNLTGLVWLKNANCFGTVTWTTALTDGNTLASGACGLTDGSVAGAWRLPNINELDSLVDRGHALPALPPGHPFTGVQSSPYWSSSTNVDNPPNAWMNNFAYGTSFYQGKSGVFSVLPVRGGQ